MNVTPVTLEGKHVRLEPIALKYEDDLLTSAQPNEIWDYVATQPGRTREQMHAWIEQAIHDTKTGKRIWFVIIRMSDGRAVGATSYLDIRPVDRGLEIGGTWLTPEVWRSAINTECKYLLLRYAFETLGCIRVQLKTDARNIRSQRAIERLGALKEGILRKHMIVWEGHQRDSIFYSIIDDEWPMVKKRLEGFLSK